MDWHRSRTICCDAAAPARLPGDEAGGRRLARRARPAAWLVLVLVAAVLASLVLLTQASAGEPGADCRHGAISAIGPVDADGRGDASPETSCLEP